MYIIIKGTLWDKNLVNQLFDQMPKMSDENNRSLDQKAPK